MHHHPVEYGFGSAVYWLAVTILDILGVVAISHGLAVFATAAVRHGMIRLPERWL
jgi:hypothetical protein